MWRVLATMCLHINWKAHAACDLNYCHSHRQSRRRRWC